MFQAPGKLFAKREQTRLLCMRRRKQRIWKGALAGLAGGVAGALAMNEFQNWWSRLQKSRSSRQKGEPARVKAAQTIVEKALHRRLPDQQNGVAGEIVHYAFGTLNGALYGAVAERAPGAAIWGGALYGAALFLLADETLVPLLGSSRGPNQYPLSRHAYAL